ncbi:MAG TPA: hypothetical protein VE978_06245 [Chitinophagales bacterium]|nr:hypothetical protein [Chitinophagales bacterium]
MKNSKKTKITLDDLFAANQAKPLTADDKKMIAQEINKYKRSHSKTLRRNKARKLA